ncbi:MAG: hypothetical protein OEV42_13860, partial [Deltaproteobacteria bacterium]|nr:hypothetical protein [Deltaproteobacteria bacterium]
QYWGCNNSSCPVNSRGLASAVFIIKVLNLVPFGCVPIINEACGASPQKEVSALIKAFDKI